MIQVHNWVHTECVHVHDNTQMNEVTSGFQNDTTSVYVCVYIFMCVYVWLCVCVYAWLVCCVKCRCVLLPLVYRLLVISSYINTLVYSSSSQPSARCSGGMLPLLLTDNAAIPHQELSISVWVCTLYVCTRNVSWSQQASSDIMMIWMKYNLRFLTDPTQF